MTNLGTLGGFGSVAYGVSQDGRVIVGYATDSNLRIRAFRWESGVMQDLGTLGGTSSVAYDVSANGAIVVGMANDTNGHPRAFRWVQGQGMQDLGALTGTTNSVAYAVTPDGNIVVGDANGVASRWIIDSDTVTFQNLGTLPGGSGSSAWDVSADGTTVVGYAGNAAGRTRAFRWSNGIMTELPIPSEGTQSQAYGVTADGRVVVGQALVSGYLCAYRWTVVCNDVIAEDLNTTYASLLNGSRLYAAYDISPDGRYIVGFGYNALSGRLEGWLLDTGSTCATHNGDVDNNCCVDDTDLLAVLFAFGNTGSNLGRVDVNCDSIVDDADLLIVLFNFGSGC